MIITGDDILSKPAEEREADLARITELVRSLRRETVPLDIGRLAAVNESGRALFYCAESRIVGCAILIIKANLSIYMSSIENVFVDADFRRRGIARTLVTQLVDYSRRRGVRQIRIVMEPENIEAGKLYASAGFEPVTRTRWRIS